MAIPSATDAAQKWATRTSSAGEDYRRGVEQTDKDPTALAIAAIPYARERWLQAVDSGRMANGLRRVGKAGWQQAVLSKGVNNFTAGVAAAQSKYAERIAPVLAYEANLQTRIASMPNGSAVDRRNRMLAWFDGMSQYRTTA